MRRAFWLPLAATLLFAIGCQEAGLPGSSATTGPDEVISDGATGTAVGNGPDGQANPHFFWLPPVAGEPSSSLLGTFDGTLRPRVEIVCLESTVASLDCDGTQSVASFEIGSGLTVGDGLYQADFDTQSADPPLEVTSGSDTTTYRILVESTTLEGLGSSGTFGVADFQVGESGKDVNNLDTGETVGLKDGRTLPIKFRLDRGALQTELDQNGVPTTAATGNLCRIRCSLTEADSGTETIAALEDGAGDTLTAMDMPDGAVRQTSVLLIDQRDTDPANLTCASGSTLEKDRCFRYILSPSNPTGDDFASPVRVGICPDPNGSETGPNQYVDEEWRILKADSTSSVGWQLTRPPETQVGDFLTCQVGANPNLALWDGPVGRAAGKALAWLVHPLEAAHFLGGQLQDLSDLFWGRDAVIRPVGSTALSVTANGGTFPVTAQIVAVHPVEGTQDTALAVPGDTVVFSVGPNGGTLSAGQVTGATSISLPTNAGGWATVTWTAPGTGGTLTAFSDRALPASGAQGGIVFTASP